MKPRSLSANLAGRVVFVVLCVATVGAFFITQRLEERPPPSDFAGFTPKNGDKVSLPFSTGRPDRVTLGIFSESGIEIRRLSTDEPLSAGDHSVQWDGKANDGQIVHSGPYSLRVSLSSEGRFFTAHTRPIVRD